MDKIVFLIIMVVFGILFINGIVDCIDRKSRGIVYSILYKEGVLASDKHMRKLTGKYNVNGDEVTYVRNEEE